MLVIQRVKHRDTEAIHAKLDELLEVNGDAKNEFMSIDAEEVERESPNLLARHRLASGTAGPVS
ncbi:low affinity iron permease family protein [Bradyrhizobium sp. SRL28]|uniref:low affinity iron permease family protein n=1 Tax=Bradyrhizobium sp. SRL28 TaxID=2836178 RepID=UPI0027DF739C|nr:low affinity iron permease family protein [Bradyrhizobium sp. SRL28]